MAMLNSPQPLFISHNPGPVTVFLHGMVMAPVFWKTYAPDICRQGTSVAYPLPGHAPWHLGEDTANLALDGIIEAYARAISRDFPGRSVTLVGHSTGGFMALGLAARHPELIDGVVLMGALACGGLDGLQPFAMRLVRLRTFGQWTFERLLALWISTPERFIRGARGCIADASAPLTRERDRHAIEQVRQALAASRTSDIAALVRLLSSSSLSGELGAIRCPCLNIVGSQDRVIHPGHQLRIQRAVPGMSTMLLDGCGHLPMVERPAKVNRVMEAFMALRHLAAHSAGQAAEQESAVELPLASDEKPRDVSIPGPVTDQIGSCAA